MSSEQYPIALFRLPFRPLFLGAGVFSAVAMGTWGWFWFAPWPFAPLGGIAWWHAHEMLFGFAGAVLIGFLLTAARTWTGLAGMGGNLLILLTLSWIAARLGIVFGGAGWLPFILVVTAVFWLIALTRFGFMILKVRMWRNLVLVPVILLMGVLDLVSVYRAVAGGDTATLQYAGMLLMLMAVTIVGGRVLPFFTGSATATPMVPPAAWIEWPLLLLTVLLFVWNFTPGLVAESPGLAVLLVLLGLFHVCRFLRWELRKAFSGPMLWSLHLPYLFLILGLFLLAAYHFSWIGNISAGVHAITAGAIGGMILSMTSRVSLGHTGRPIEAGKALVAAFMLIAAAALIRTVGPLMLDSGYLPTVYHVSACLWCISWVIWLWQFTPVLVQPRADGKGG